MELAGREAAKAIACADYHKLSELLSLCHDIPHIHSSTLSQAVASVHCIAQEDWRECFLAHFRACKAKDRIDALLEAQIDALQAFLRIAVASGRECLPVLYCLCSDLEKWSWLGDKTKIEEAARTINRSFTVCITDRAALHLSRKHGTFKLMAILFRMYFKMRQLNLCRQLIRAVQVAELPDFPANQVGEYKYWYGKFLVADGAYEAGLKELREAVVLCAPVERNFQRCLLFYIPCHVIVSPLQMPAANASMPETYTLAFSLIARGEYLEYRDFLQRNFSFFTKLRLFLVFQRFQLLCLRNFVRRIHTCLQALSGLNATRIPVKLIMLMGSFPCIDHLTCLLAGLISRGAIRGYLSESAGYLVLSAKDPFPSFSLL